MKLLVTGARGFIGSHLIPKLIQEGHTVEALTRREVIPNMLVHLYDGTLAGMEGIFRRSPPDAVIHLASQFVAEHTPADVDSLAQANILFGMHLLEAMNLAGVDRLLTAGSFWQHFEGKAYSPASLYAATKQAFEDILRFYAEAKKMRALVLTLYDTYGPGDFRNKLFSQLRKASLEGRLLPMSGGEQKIDLVHIDDCVEGFLIALRLLQSLKLGEILKFALAGGEPLSLKEIVAVYEEVTGRRVGVEWGRRPYRSREMMFPWVVEEILPGWRPRVGLAEGIRKMEGP